MPIAGGGYGFGEVYSGGNTNAPAAPTDCASECFIVNPNGPSIATSLSPASPVSIGTAVHDTATLTGATATAGGSVTYTVYSESTCRVAVKIGRASGREREEISVGAASLKKKSTGRGDC